MINKKKKQIKDDMVKDKSKTAQLANLGTLEKQTKSLGYNHLNIFAKNMCILRLCQF